MENNVDDKKDNILQLVNYDDIKYINNTTRCEKIFNDVKNILRNLANIGYFTSVYKDVLIYIGCFDKKHTTYEKSFYNNYVMTKLYEYFSCLLIYENDKYDSHTGSNTSMPLINSECDINYNLVKENNMSQIITINNDQSRIESYVNTENIVYVYVTINQLKNTEYTKTLMDINNKVLYLKTLDKVTKDIYNRSINGEINSFNSSLSFELEYIYVDTSCNMNNTNNNIEKLPTDHAYILVKNYLILNGFKTDLSMVPDYSSSNKKMYTVILTVLLINETC